MASIIKKIKKGRPYYYAVECKRVNGKPRIVWQKYLGTVEGILERTENAKPAKPKETVVFEAGGVAALLGITQRLGLMELIDQVCPKRQQGPTVGHYIVLAALNRALCPVSKQAIGDWYEQTVLRRLWGFDKTAFSSQRFWDHMDRFSEEDIETVQERLLARLDKEWEVDAGLLLYDTTNFFTFLATNNDRCSLGQRGRNKQKRHDLRQLGLALLVSGDFQTPLLHHLYAGNIPDVSLFSQLRKQLTERYQAVTGKLSDATIVMDKGNVSDDVMEQLIDGGTHFVVALAANRLKSLLAIPRERFALVESMPGTCTFDVIEELWGRSCRVVVVYTESFFTQQLQGVTQNLVKCQKKLLDLGKNLQRWREGKNRGKQPTVAGVRKSVARILSAQFMKDLIRIEIKQDVQTDLPVLTYHVDHAALQCLSEQRLGRTLLVSNRTDWTATQIVEAYRSLSGVEDAFKAMKNTDFLRWRPAFHWTDQKLSVHTMYCVIALLLSSLAKRIALQAGVDISLPTLLNELSKIHEVAVIYPQGTLAHPKDHLTLSRLSPRQKKLAQALNIAQVLSS